VAAKKVEKLKESQFIWMDGKLVPWADAKVHVLTHSLHYGVAVFEGIPATPSLTAAGPSSACASTCGASSRARTSA